MNADKILAAEEIVAVTAIVTGDVLAQGSARGLPSPRRLIAAFALYGILSLAASFGQGAARFAAAAGGVIMLTTLVLGPGGTAVTKLVGNLTAFAQTGEGAAGKPSPPAASASPTPKPSVAAKIISGLQKILNFGGLLPLLS